MTTRFLYSHPTPSMTVNTLREMLEAGVSSFRCGGLAFILFTLTVLALILPAVPASADTYQLICENPRREYTVSYGDGDTNIELGAPEGVTLYRVLAVERTAERHVVVALTINDGPTVRLSLRPYLRMEYWSGNQLFQTDACRSPRS